MRNAVWLYLTGMSLPFAWMGLHWKFSAGAPASDLWMGLFLGSLLAGIFLTIRSSFLFWRGIRCPCGCRMRGSGPRKFRFCLRCAESLEREPVDDSEPAQVPLLSAASETREISSSADEEPERSTRQNSAPLARASVFFSLGALVAMVATMVSWIALQGLHLSEQTEPFLWMPAAAFLASAMGATWCDWRIRCGNCEARLSRIRPRLFGVRLPKDMHYCPYCGWSIDAAPGPKKAALNQPASGL